LKKLCSPELTEIQMGELFYSSSFNLASAPLAMAKKASSRSVTRYKRCINCI